MQNSQLGTWHEITDFFRSNFSNLYTSFSNLVVDQAAASGYASQLFASQSLATLIVSTEQEWPARMLAPHIMVHPHPSGEVIIEFFDKPIHRGDPGVCRVKVECTNEDAGIQLEPMMKDLTYLINIDLEDQ